MAIRIHVSIVTLNVNRLEAPTMEDRLAEWIQKQGTDICCIQDTNSVLETHTDWKWGEGKWHSTKWKSKES